MGVDPLLALAEPPSVMDQDIRDTPLFKEAEALYRSIRQPGTGQISDAADLHVAPSGRCAVFSASVLDRLEGAPVTRIARIDLDTGDSRLLTFGPNTDRAPRYSPDGATIAFLSDRHSAGDFQLYLLDPVTGAAAAAPRTEGWIEYLHWSPDGRRILLGVAGHGADVSGGQGAVTSRPKSQDRPSWLPDVDSGKEKFRWRRIWVYEPSSGELRPVGGARLNVWEGAWCGNDAIAAIASEGPEEGLWYRARLHLIRLFEGESRVLHVPEMQLGWPAASPSGKTLAVVEAVCSDRWFVAGDLLLIDVASGARRQLDTHRIDITYTEWRSDERLLVAGHRGFETVVALWDAASETFRELWSSSGLTTGGFYASVCACNDAGDFLMVGESFTRGPEIARVMRGQYSVVRSFDLARDRCGSLADVERLTWHAPDGLEIQGWLLRPKSPAPYPLILNIHGGPIGHWRPTWLGRRNVAILMLLARGFAVLLPNPRGSVGYGQPFARAVLGDLGGADTFDCLAGVDHLVGKGFADPRRLGVTGGSYGGFMTSWLITQDPRFAAAIPVAPVTNQVTAHLISNIPQFVQLFLGDSYTNHSGRYFTRSPVLYADRVSTPTLNICGALDRCTPPEEAVQFHAALRENGVESVLVSYPEEGHGVRRFPAAADFAARVVGWFEEHLERPG